MAQSTFIWNLMAKRYAKAPIADEEAYQKKLTITRQYLNPSTRLLEFGCGTGSTAIAHAPYTAHVLATDFSKNMLQIARDKAEAAELKNIEFKQIAVEDIEMPAESFDVVLGMSILHIVENMDEVIQKVQKLLKPGGIFITSTVCLNNIGIGWKSALKVSGFLGLLPPIKFLSEEEIVSSIRSAGFEIEQQWRPGERDAAFVVARKIE